MVLEETGGCRQSRRISSEAASGEYRIRLSGFSVVAEILVLELWCCERRNRGTVDMRIFFDDVMK
jgi:hypothetical protein